MTIRLGLVAASRIARIAVVAPIEDVGGPWGYADFLDAIADPDHENHDDMTEWYGDDFDPQDVPLDGLKADVADLAARWNRKPGRRKPK